MQEMDQLVQRIVSELKQKKLETHEPAAPLQERASDLSYPLQEHCADRLKAKSGKSYSAVTFDALIRGEIEKEDLKTHADTLRMQAKIAYQNGKKQFGDNLMRAAEMTAIPDEEVLELYNMLRPNRTDKQTLLATAQRVRQEYGAEKIAALIESAAKVYEKRGIIKV
mgnify:CR=1 FL=1